MFIKRILRRIKHATGQFGAVPAEQVKRLYESTPSQLEIDSMSPRQIAAASDEGMDSVTRYVDRSIIIASLGSAMDGSLSLPPQILKACTLLRLDALAPGSDDAAYGELISIKQLIAGVPGLREFATRSFPNCSSVLEPEQSLVDAYDLGKYFELQSKSAMQATTLAQAMQDHKLLRLDVIKTDLEGLDFEVIRSLGEDLASALVIVMETRFQPLYVGEPRAEEVIAFMTSHGFELLVLRPEVWKYDTGHRHVSSGGRTVMADITFVRSPAEIDRRFGQGAGKAIVRQVIALWMLGLKNYAEFILERHGAAVPGDVRNALTSGMFPEGDTFVRPMMCPGFPHVDKLD